MACMIFHLCRNITDVLSCFSDSPPPSPTFPEGGNPVLYGEEDNKVNKNRLVFGLSRAGHWPAWMCVFEWNVNLFCHPECPGWTHPYPECGYKDRQRHWWRWPCSYVPGVHSVKGLQQNLLFQFKFQQRELNVWDGSERSFHPDIFPFYQSQKSLLFEHGIRRLTFLVAQKVRVFIHVYQVHLFCHNLLPCMSPIQLFLSSMYQKSTICPASFFFNY